jgi:hypothetical protein
MAKWGRWGSGFPQEDAAGCLLGAPAARVPHRIDASTPTSFGHRAIQPAIPANSTEMIFSFSNGGGGITKKNATGGRSAAAAANLY